MKKLLVMFSLVSMSVNAFANGYTPAASGTLDPIQTRLQLQGKVDRHCSLDIYDGLDADGTAKNAVAALDGSKDLVLDFGDLYKKTEDAAANKEVSARLHVECNDDFVLSAKSSYGGLVTQGNNGGAQLANVSYNIKEVSIAAGSIKLVEDIDNIAASVAGQSMPVTIEQAQIDLGRTLAGDKNKGVDDDASVVLKIAKGQYPAGDYVDTMTIEMAAP